MCRHPGCGKAYATSDAARKHVRNHHPEWLKVVELEKRGIDGYCKRIENSGFPMDMCVVPSTPWQHRAAIAMNAPGVQVRDPAETAAYSPGVVGPTMMALPGQVMPALMPATYFVAYQAPACGCFLC